MNIDDSEVVITPIKYPQSIGRVSRKPKENRTTMLLIDDYKFERKVKQQIKEVWEDER